MSVLIETTIGDLVVDLYVKERPRSCLNFLKLCAQKYYNFCPFHSIEQNFIAQTGSPDGTLTGGESIFGRLYGPQARYFEMESVPKLRHGRKGTVSMVNNGTGGHGSQLFFTLADDLDYLDGVHTVIGQVTEGFSTLSRLNEAICDEQHRPYQDIRICHTILLDDPFPNPTGLELPPSSPLPTLAALRSFNIGVDEEVDDSEGKSAAQLQEEMERKEARARATILEMVGDLRDADEKPPDNVLFVCKLNAVTTEEDLEVIFARFGPIKCCEVIRDRKTGNSLQYAFVEFEEADHCENAFLKMDNVLIDDRRIHVDFSQSVAKNFQWKKRSAAENQQLKRQLGRK